MKKEKDNNYLDNNLFLSQRNTTHSSNIFNIQTKQISNKNKKINTLLY